MLTCRDDARGWALPALAICFTVGSFTPFAQGQPFTDAGGEPPFIGCGKSRAAARVFRAASAQTTDPAYLEMMNHTDVLHYALDIEITNIDPANNTCTITGSNTMTIRSLSASLSEFSFRLRSQFDVPAAYINGSTQVTVTTTTPSTRLVTLDRIYGMDETFDLTIEYTGNTVSVSWGSIEVRSHSGGIPIVSTLSEPYYAYTWWPAKDGEVLLAGDNSDKATLEFFITAPDNFTVAANGLLVGTDSLAGNRKRFRWASDYPIATYLVSFSATQYNTWTAAYNHPGGSMPVEFYIYPSSDYPANRAAWEKAVDMLETFRPIFGEYPFIDEKYGIYNFPFGGGMEHQTITGQGGFSEWLTSHELAHQWWGDMITCKTWNHIWLNEGFATYAEALWEEHKPGSSGLPALISYMAGRKYLGAGSVYVYDDEVDELGQIFHGGTSYRKGAWVLHMLRHVLGDESFFAALAAYRSAFEHGAVTTEDFQAVCENFYGGEDLAWFFQEWVYGERAPAYAWGFDTVEVNGKHYLLVAVDQTQLASYQRFEMPIDIVVDEETYVVFNDADPEHFVIPVPSAPTSVQFDPDEWILRYSVTEMAYNPGPPAIVETDPAPGEAVAYSDATTSITITFHTNVNVAADDISLVGADTGSWPVTLAGGAGGDINPVVVNLPFPLLPDSYTLTVASGIEASNSGLPLDGELADPNDPGSLPSGDGVAGGDAVIGFTVTSSLTPGDFDGDTDRDVYDVDEFTACMTGPEAASIRPECAPGDFDLDYNVDLADFRVFQAMLSSP